ncbi:MAG: hypothetical protein RhofKO_05070 [Rhodothermales bacterium]
MRGARFIVALVLLAGSAQSVQAQRVEAYVDADSITVGDRFHLSLVATHDIGTEALFLTPSISDTLFGDLVVTRRLETYQRTTLASRRVDSTVYEVTTFALDTAYVASIPVLFSVDGGDTTFAASRPMFLPVTSLVPEDATAIRDLAPLAEFPRPIWPWILAVAVLLAVCALLYYFWRKQQNKPDEPEMAMPEAPAIPAYEEAMQRLQALEQVDLYNDSAVKLYYVELSDLFRRYVDRKLNIHAMESTTRELLWTLRKGKAVQAFTEADLEDIHRVLDLSDIVKFADHRPAPDQGRDALMRTRALVEAVETRMRPVVATPQPDETEVADAVPV